MLIACLSLVYIAETMKIDNAANKYLPAMNRVKTKIEKAFQKLYKKRRATSELSKQP
jgi:hypothetical protein